MPSDPLTTRFAQQPSPPGGYSVAHFRDQLDGMAQRLATMVAEGDARAVFQCTYLAFSRQVLAALEAGRFHDCTWATDMCCRFVQAYLDQLERWEAGDPDQCLAWRHAFGVAAAGTCNTLQAMALGMNAHINYDLAFVTLGACRHAGDLTAGTASTRALGASRTGVPLVRYRDFLVINQVAWESIPKIQDEVLRTFSPWLDRGNRFARPVTHAVGQRLLLEARDTSWCQTALLVHARDAAEHDVVARSIDVYAGGVADGIGVLTVHPSRMWRSAVTWRHRGRAVPEDVRRGLTQLACDNPVVAALCLHQLAVIGADPAPVVADLVERDERRLAAQFVDEVMRYGARERRTQLRRHLRGGSDGALAVVETQLERGSPASIKRRGTSGRVVVARWGQLRRWTSTALLLPEVRAAPYLRDALADDLGRLDERIGRLPALLRAHATARGRTEAGRHRDAQLLVAHPDAWVRLCAEHALDTTRNGGDAMTRLIERVLFLKETSLFLEVEAAVLLGLAGQLQPRSYAPGTLLVRHGAPTLGLHLIRRGQVEVVQRRPGGDLCVAELGPHEAVGELSVLTDSPATADCRATTPVEAYFLPAQALAHLLHAHPRLAIGLIRMLSKRLIDTTQRLEAHAQALVSDRTSDADRQP